MTELEEIQEYGKELRKLFPRILVAFGMRGDSGKGYYVALPTNYNKVGVRPIPSDWIHVATDLTSNRYITPAIVRIEVKHSASL